MAASDDLEPRVAALETQVQALTTRDRRSERDAAAARVLAGAVDRDVTELRAELRDFRQATTSSFNAMREDLTDLRKEMNSRFTEVDNRFAKVDMGFAKVDMGFAEMRSKFDAAAAGQQQIVNLLNTLITQDGGQAADR
jgi:hypothetical protein